MFLHTCAALRLQGCKGEPMFDPMKNPYSFDFSALPIGARFVRNCLTTSEYAEVKVSETGYRNMRNPGNIVRYSPLGMGETCIALDVADVSDVLGLPTEKQVRSWIANAHQMDAEFCRTHFNLGSLSSHCARLASFRCVELRAYMAVCSAIELNTPSEYYEPTYHLIPERMSSATLDAYRNALELERAIENAVRRWATSEREVRAWRDEQAKQSAERARVEVEQNRIALQSALYATPSKGKHKGESGQIFWRGNGAKGLRLGVQFADRSRQFYAFADVALG
jgi:hypothetical protein